jgi:probable HAF family extracellular repeat protein
MRILRYRFMALLLGAALATSAAAAPTYRVIILSSAGAQGNSIDQFGVVGGSYTLASGAVHASVWAFGHQIDLGTLGKGAGLSSKVQWPAKNYQGILSGISLTDALDPNKEGWSCGFFLPNPDFHVCRGFVWSPFDGAMRALPTLGGTNGFATGSNDFGETVGWAENKVHDPSCESPQVLQFRPVVWGPGRSEIRELPLISGDSDGAATALNDRGQIVGISGACGIAVGGVSAAHAVLWENGVARLLENPNHAPYFNTPMMINQRGDVVGFAGAPEDPAGNFTPPFAWNAQQGWRFLPLLSGDIAGVATSINNQRTIVGYSNDASGNLHAWLLWHGKLYNLNDLFLPGDGLEGTGRLAFDINDRGEITGAAVTATSSQAFVAVPVGEWTD